MIDGIKTAQGVAAIVVAVFATVVAWWNLGFIAENQIRLWKLRM